MDRQSIKWACGRRATAREAAAAAIVGLLAALTLAAPAAAQYCSQTNSDGVLVEMIPQSGSVASTEPRCLGAFYCEETEIGGPQTEAIFDPVSGTYTVRVKVPLTMPDNSKNDGTDGTYTGLRARLHWFADSAPPEADCYPGFNDCVPYESCGPLGATIDFDQGFASISMGELTCQNLAGDSRLRTYSFSVLRCASPFGDCTTRADSPPIDLSPPAVRGILNCGRKHSCCHGECEPCPVGSGASVGGGGPVSCPVPPRDGGGAALGYSARGAGTPGSPGSAAWRTVLGRGWSHDYAERIVPDPDDSHVWLITRFGTFREFWRPVDGVYQEVSPSNEYRTLTRTVSGWELRDLDGTVMSFGADGRWAGTADANGNAKLPTYDGAGALTEVAFPDARTERFTYHPDGKLAAITEVGVDGVTSRTWSYTWNGDDLARIDRPDGTAAEYFYNDPRHPGYLTRVDEVATDGDRRTDRGYEHDAEGNVVRTWRGDTAAGANGDIPGPAAVMTWAFSFDDPEQPSETLVTDPLGNVSTYLLERDPRSEMPRVTSISGNCPACGLGPNTMLFYDDPDNPLRPTRTVDGRGTQTLMTWDSNGKMTSRTEAFGTPLERVTSWGYGDPAFPAVATRIERPSTSGSGNRETRLLLDGAGNPITSTISGIEDGSAFSLDTITTFTPEGQPFVFDPPGYGTTDQRSFTYDPARGNLLPLTRTDPLIGSTAFGYDPLNRRTSTTDPNGVSVEITYDALDRVRFTTLKGVTASDDLVTESVYNGFGDLVRRILPRGNVLEFGYDDVGRLVSFARGAAPGEPRERTVFDLDAAGNRIREERQRWQGGVWVTHASTDFVYSSRCQLDRIDYPDGSATEYAYNCNGSLEHVWDANHPSAGQSAPPTHSYVYDELNRLVSITQPWAGSGGGHSVTSYAYDAQDHPTEVTDAEGNVTRFSYSDRDLPTERISEVTGRTTYAYNEHGNLIRQDDARGVSVHLTVDALGRVRFMDYPENALDTSYSWDGPGVPFSKGRLTAITRAGSAVEYEYDRFGRVTRDGALGFSYDENGNRTRIDYPEGVAATYTHDFADREDSLTLQQASGPSQPIVTDVEYLPLGPVSRLDLGNGLTETRDFDSRYVPRGIAVSSLLDWDYTTDGLGNILGITDTLRGQSRSFDYLEVDSFLTRGDGPWGNLSWVYDKIGNRLSESRDGLADVYRYQTNGSGGRSPRLTEIQHGTGGTSRFFYDAAGNQTYLSTEERKLRLSYDAAGRVAQVATDADSTGELSQFSYDGRGFLARSELTPFLGHPPAIRTTPTYSSQGLLLHKQTVEVPGPQPARDEGTTTTDSFVLIFAGRPVGVLEETEKTDGQGQSTEVSRLRYLTTDHLRTPLLETDSSGSITWSGGFEPFGSDSFDAAGAGLFLRLWGQWNDESWTAGWADYNLHRWYRPGAGRYSRPDPLGPFGSARWYAYADNNPLRMADPLGLAEWNCTSVGFEFATGAGVSFKWGTCKSECELGARWSVNYSWRRVGIGFGTQVSLPFSFGVFGIDDGGGTANPRNFSYVGPLCSTGLSAMIGGGPTFGQTQFGEPASLVDWDAWDWGADAGLGLSGFAGCGKFNVSEPKLECCREPGEEEDPVPGMRATYPSPQDRPPPTIGPMP